MKENSIIETDTSTELVEKVKDNLTRGDISRIAEKIGLSKMTVSNHLLGKTKQPSLLILEVAIKIINERKAAEKQLAKILG